jgi:hypothetical protein
VEDYGMSVFAPLQAHARNPDFDTDVNKPLGSSLFFTCPGQPVSHCLFSFLLISTYMGGSGACSANAMQEEYAMSKIELLNLSFEATSKGIDLVCRYVPSTESKASLTILNAK